LFLTRAYQDFIGYVVNIADIIQEYNENFDAVCSELDPNYEYEGNRVVSDLSHTELFAGTTELLLRGNFGRFSPAPLIRSAIELIITRTVFNTEYSSKYKGKTVFLKKNFQLDDILKASEKMGIQFQVCADNIKRFYTWGSMSTHKGSRMEHCEIWHALRSAQHIASGGLIICEDAKLGEQIDRILDRLLINDKIMIQ
jgi:hypothetical protein